MIDRKLERVRESEGGREIRKKVKRGREWEGEGRGKGGERGEENKSERKRKRRREREKEGNEWVVGKREGDI